MALHKIRRREIINARILVRKFNLFKNTFIIINIIKIEIFSLLVESEGWIF